MINFLLPAYLTHIIVIYASRYSRMDLVKFVEDSL